MPATPIDIGHPLELVVMSRARLQEAVDDAVARGRLSAVDGADLVDDLVARGRAQAAELQVELGELARAVGATRAAALAIPGYDDLSSAEIVRALDGLGEDELRRVAQYERANANRKLVLVAVERRLAP